MFASLTQQTLLLPFDPPHSVTIRKLTGREVERAQGEHLKGLISGSRSSRGWAEAFQRNLAKGTPGAVAAVLADPLNGFDRSTILACGLLGWSHPTPPFSLAAIDDLDDDAAEFIARAILQLTKPALFLTVEAAQEEKKTATAVSTAA